MRFAQDDSNKETGSGSAVLRHYAANPMPTELNYMIDRSMQFPLVNINLGEGESVFIQTGSMVYHDVGVTLQTRLNGRGRGVHKYLSALGRSFTSGENMLITEASCSAPRGTIALAPQVPGDIIVLTVGNGVQYKINDGKFLAMGGKASYKMERQSVGRALFSGTGGFYIMTTDGIGTVICNSYGSIRKLVLRNQSVTIDNYHVVAWSSGLDYNVHLESGWLNSMTNGEGIVNTFSGTGTVYVQSLNLQSLADGLAPLLPSKRN